MAKFSIWPVTVYDMRCCKIIRVLCRIKILGEGGLNSAVNDCRARYACRFNV